MNYDKIRHMIADYKDNITGDITSIDQIIDELAYQVNVRDNKVIKGCTTSNTLKEDADLSELENYIEKAKGALLTYEYGWDDEYGQPTDEITFGKASNFLIKYATYIANKYSIIISIPFINIMNDGSIYVQWDCVDYNFLIIFKKSNTSIAYFYTMLKGSIEMSLKGGVNIDGDVNVVVSLWMSRFTKTTK